jgi:hypothetical protein
LPVAGDGDEADGGAEFELDAAVRASVAEASAEAFAKG